MERRFDIGLPVQIVHSHWEAFKREHEDSPARLEMEPAGSDSTRVRLLAPQNTDAGALDLLADHFRHYLEAFPPGAARAR